MGRLLNLWEGAIHEERAQLVQMVSEAVYVDTVAKEIVAYLPKQQYRALFTLYEGLRGESGLLVTHRYEQLAGIGDPDRWWTPPTLLKTGKLPVESLRWR